MYFIASRLTAWFRVVAWWAKDILRDVALAALEACIVLLVSNVAWIVISIKYALDNRGMEFPRAFVEMFNSIFEPTEILIYVSAILSPTIAYIVIRVGALRGRAVYILLVLPIACLLIWISTPLYMSGLEGVPPNADFAFELAAVLGVSAIALWYVALFAQRRLFERRVVLSGDQRGQEIVKRVGGLNER